jgi:hypothetical protein
MVLQSSICRDYEIHLQNYTKAQMLSSCISCPYNIYYFPIAVCRKNVAQVSRASKICQKKFVVRRSHVRLDPKPKPKPKYDTVHLDVAAATVAMTRSSRVARATRAVTMAGGVGCALNNNAVAVVAVMTVDQECEQGCDEEEDDVPG